MASTGLKTVEEAQRQAAPASAKDVERANASAAARGVDKGPKDGDGLPLPGQNVQKAAPEGESPVLYIATTPEMIFWPELGAMMGITDQGKLRELGVAGGYSDDMRRLGQLIGGAIGGLSPMPRINLPLGLAVGGLAIAETAALLALARAVGAKGILSTAAVITAGTVAVGVVVGVMLSLSWKPRAR